LTQPVWYRYIALPLACRRRVVRVTTRQATLMLVFAALWAGRAVAQPAGTQPAHAPATTPAVTTDRPIIARIALRIPDRAERAEYWVRTPPDYTVDGSPALLIALHGTDDTARQMIDFWSGLRTPVPVLLIAPQGVGKGWSEADLPTIRAMWADLQKRFGFDEQRVLLAGFSAGGAMVFELLYKERLPVTAAAALANYVPPRVTAEEVAARRQVPVFYAVGMADLNHERMRAGLEFLRSAGANVKIHRPRIGHTLDATVAQEALDYCFEQFRKRLDTAIDQAAKDTDLPAAIARLEAITTQARWHEPAAVERAAQVLERRERPGRDDLKAAEDLVWAGRKAEAAELFKRIELAYGQGRLSRQARLQREQLESEPAVRDELARREARRRADEAQALYAAAQRLVIQNRRQEAAAKCQDIISRYSETPAATRAQRLLKMLEARRTP